VVLIQRFDERGVVGVCVEVPADKAHVKIIGASKPLLKRA